MAMRRKEQRGRRVVATPHPPRANTRLRTGRSTSHAAAAVTAAPASAAALSGAVGSSPVLKQKPKGDERAVAASGKRVAGRKRKAEADSDAVQVAPGAKKRKSRAVAVAGDCDRSGYGEQLAAAGFVYPRLATSQPAYQTHNNRPDGPTHPPLARRTPLTIEEAKKLTKDDPPVRVYADGVFDLFHYGHARLLMQAKQSFTNVCLVSGIPSDDVVQMLKGQTVLTAEERMTMMRHSRYVDEVIEDAPFTPTLEFLEHHKIDFVAHDEKPLPALDRADIYAEVKAAKRFVGTHRTDGISTSDLIARIVRNYDTYVRRNLSRGYPREGMGLSYVREQGVKARGRMHDWVKTWKGSRRALIGGFLNMFGPVTGPISSLFKTAVAASPPDADRPSRRSKAGRGSAARLALEGRFHDFLDDDDDTGDEEQEEEDVKPWFKETAQFLLSESESDENHAEEES